MVTLDAPGGWVSVNEPGVLYMTVVGAKPPPISMFIDPLIS